MAVTASATNHLGVDAVAVGLNLTVLDPGSTGRVYVKGYKLERSVADGYIELHFGDQSAAHKIDRQGAPPLGMGQGDSNLDVTGAVGEILKMSANGTGVLNGYVKAWIIQGASHVKA